MSFRCKKCGARGRINYPFGRKSKGRTSIVHRESCPVLKDE
jgi:hypothetical protein